MDDQTYLQKGIQWAKSHGFSDIKANLDDYDKPVSYTKPKEDTPYIPNITGKRTGRKFYIEVATKSEDIKRQVSKWKLLSTLATMKGGKLFLLAPKGHKAFVMRVLKRYNLNANVVYLPNT